MSDENREPKEESVSSDIELETEKMMDKVLKTSTIDTVTGDDREKSQTTASQIDITFQRLQNRILDLLGTIEDSLREIEPGISDRVSGIMENVTKQLNSAGLGVFANRAINLVREEVEGGFAVEDILSLVYQNIEKSRLDVEDIMTKVGRGAVKNVGHSATTLQARLIQMHAHINEMEKKLEASRAELHKWRGRVTELEERIRQGEEHVESFNEEIRKLQDEIAKLNQELGVRDKLISSMKGNLSQTQSQVEQQKEIIANMGSMESITIDLDAKMLELSQLKGQITQYIEMIEQKDSEIESAKNDMESAKKQKADIEDVLAKATDEMATLRGAKQSYDVELSELKTHLNELKARWDALYSIAEDEPAFKAYFLVADKTQWFQLSHLSSALGIPTVLLKRQMQKFIDAGLLEIDNDKIRARSLSDLAREAEGREAQMIEDARAELGEGAADEDGLSKSRNLISQDSKHPNSRNDDCEQDDS